MAEGDLNWPRANLTQAKTYSVSSSLLRDIAHVRLVVVSGQAAMSGLADIHTDHARGLLVGQS
jgi:hypothetical protein